MQTSFSPAQPATLVLPSRPNTSRPVRFGFVQGIRNRFNSLWPKKADSTANATADQLSITPAQKPANQILQIDKNDPAYQELLAKQQKKGIVFFDALQDAAKVFKQRNLWKDSIEITNSSASSLDKNLAIWNLMLARFFENYPDHSFIIEKKTNAKISKPAENPPSEVRPNRLAYNTYYQAIKLAPILAFITFPFDVSKQLILASSNPEKTAAIIAKPQSAMDTLRESKKGQSKKSDREALEEAATNPLSIAFRESFYTAMKELKAEDKF